MDMDIYNSQLLVTRSSREAWACFSGARFHLVGRPRQEFIDGTLDHCMLEIYSVLWDQESDHLIRFFFFFFLPSPELAWIRTSKKKGIH